METDYPTLMMGGAVRRAQAYNGGSVRRIHSLAGGVDIGKPWEPRRRVTNVIGFEPPPPPPGAPVDDPTYKWRGPALGWGTAAEHNARVQAAFDQTGLAYRKGMGITTREEAQRKWEAAADRHDPVGAFFRKVNKGLTAIADVGSNIMPGMAADIYQNFAPPGSIYHDPSAGGARPTGFDGRAKEGAVIRYPRYSTHSGIEGGSAALMPVGSGIAAHLPAGACVKAAGGALKSSSAGLAPFSVKPTVLAMTSEVDTPYIIPSVENTHTSGRAPVLKKLAPVTGTRPQSTLPNPVTGFQGPRPVTAFDTKAQIRKTQHDLRAAHLPQAATSGGAQSGGGVFEFPAHGVLPKLYRKRKDDEKEWWERDAPKAKTDKKRLLDRNDFVTKLYRELKGKGEDLSYMEVSKMVKDRHMWPPRK